MLGKRKVVQEITYFLHKNNYSREEAYEVVKKFIISLKNYPSANDVFTMLESFTWNWEQLEQSFEVE